MVFPSVNHHWEKTHEALIHPWMAVFLPLPSILPFSILLASSTMYAMDEENVSDQAVLVIDYSHRTISQSCSIQK